MPERLLLFIGKYQAVDAYGKIIYTGNEINYHFGCKF